MGLKRDIENIGRFREILQVAIEEGFFFLIENSALSASIPWHKKIRRKADHKVRHEVRLRKSLERLGPTFIKLGQMLSVRPDIVPKEYIHELEKLQDHVDPLPFSVIKGVIEKSTGKAIPEMFSHVDRKPIASASISQVHAGRLLTGENVAIKVKRPGIEEVISKDIDIMQFIAGVLEKHSKTLRPFCPTEIVQEFSEWTHDEIDFAVEADNIQKFHRNFEGSKTTAIPQLYFSNHDILIMERLMGIELHKANKKGISKFIENGFYSMMKQVFVHGLFHADPHPSNILVLKNNKVGFVDFGIVGRFDEDLKNKSCDLLVGIGQGNENKVVEALLELGEIREGSDLAKFKKEVYRKIMLLQHSELKDIRISRTLEDVLDLSLSYGIRMPKEFVLFGKAIITLEGVALLYAPEFHFSEKLSPFLEEVLLERYEPKRMLADSLREFIGLKKTIEKIPLQASRVLDRLERGSLKIEMKDTDISQLSVEIDRSSNRLSYGMIIAALLISGSLIYNIGSPALFGLPIFSLILFGFAAFIGIALIISIINERR